MYRARIGSILTCCLIVPAVLNGQFLHDERRASKSAETAKAAKEVTSGTIFNKQLSNLDVLSRASSARVFEGAELQMRGRLSLFSSRWEVIDDLVAEISEALNDRGAVSADQVTVEKTRLATARANLTAELNALKAKIAGMNSVDTQLAAMWLARLGKLEELESLAVKADLLKEPNASQKALLAEVSDTFEALAELYKNFAITLPASPSVLLLQSQLDILKAEETHVKTLGLIVARRESEAMDIRATLATVEMQMNCVLNRKESKNCPLGKTYVGLDIRSSLELAVKKTRDAMAAVDANPNADTRRIRTANERELQDLLDLLLNAASLAARGDTPLRLAQLRRAEEERRDSIRKSAAAARSYEQLLVNGADRLALYYQGGVSAGDLARIANALATLGLIPVIGLH